MRNPLLDDIIWYKEHQEELLKKYDRKSILIKNKQIVHEFEDVLSALDYVMKNKIELCEYLMQFFDIEKEKIDCCMFTPKKEGDKYENTSK